MNIALVILNWNGKQLLQQFLPSVLANSGNAKIYVVDNASTDTSIQFLEDNYPTIKIIKNENNEGYAKGYNTGLQQIDADVYCLLNSDVEVTPNWLTPIINTYNEDSNASIIQPKILDFKNKHYFEYAGAAGGYIDKYGYSFCRGRVFDAIEKDTNQYKSAPVFWASGACLFIKANDFKLLGGFDEDYFAHYEEIDLCWRAKNRGLPVNYVADSTVYHLGGATLQNSNPLKTYLNFRNSLFTLVKNLPRKKLIPIVFTRMVLDGIAGVRFVLRGEFSLFFSVLKAHTSFYKNLVKMTQKREIVHLENYFYTKSIVRDFFISKQKTFKS